MSRLFAGCRGFARPPGSLRRNSSSISTPTKLQTLRYTPEEGVLIAFAPHQWVAAGGVDVWRGLRVNSSATVWSSRWGYLPVDDSGEGRMDTVRPAIILDLTAVWRNAVVDGLDLRLAALNLLDDNWMLLQAYDGGHAPLPGRGRQYTLAGSYAF